MPNYRLRFTAESSLTNDSDVTLSHEGIQFRFLFSVRKPDGYLRVELEIEAGNNRDAQNIANADLLPRALDALSFSTGTPLLVKECELILKDQTGSDLRQAIYVSHKKQPTKIALSRGALEEAQQLMRSESVALPLRWHRYALDRQLPMDQFIFNWLAFESLAGDAVINSKCPRCAETLSHCGVPVTHAGSSKVRAAELYGAANPTVPVQDFMQKIWNRARNKVFHGKQYPEPAYLSELFEISQSVRKASDKQIARLAGVTGNNPNHRYEELFRIFFFVEWKTSDPTRAFASDWPEGELEQRVDAVELNRVLAGAPPASFRLLDYSAASTTW
jgi:hypothetical protein